MTDRSVVTRFLPRPPWRLVRAPLPDEPHLFLYDTDTGWCAVCRLPRMNARHSS